MGLKYGTEGRVVREYGSTGENHDEEINEYLRDSWMIRNMM